MAAEAEAEAETLRRREGGVGREKGKERWEGGGLKKEELVVAVRGGGGWLRREEGGEVKADSMTAVPGLSEKLYRDRKSVV